MSIEIVAVFLEMKALGVNHVANGSEIKDDIRHLREAGRKICATKEKAVRFLASTGMYTATGQLKRRFR